MREHKGIKDEHGIIQGAAQMLQVTGYKLQGYRVTGCSLQIFGFNLQLVTCNLQLTNNM